MPILFTILEAVLPKIIQFKSQTISVYRQVIAVSGKANGKSSSIIEIDQGFDSARFFGDALIKYITLAQVAFFEIHRFYDCRDSIRN
ncbi:MAG: hypothetical protein HOE30_25355 [Deltaproteobacteria bacterium]|jgi:hypothetical protein|nr:hypothetical protein [Deltaproteobacteria bacterium]